MLINSFVLPDLFMSQDSDSTYIISQINLFNNQETLSPDILTRLYNKSIFKPINIDGKIELEINELLNYLGVPENIKPRYLKQKISIINFLFELYNFLKAQETSSTNTNRQNFLSCVQELKKKNNFSSAEKALLILLAIVSLTLLVTIALVVPESLSLLQSLILTTVFPIALGMSYSLSILAYSIYTNHKNPKLQNNSLKDVLKNNFWILSSTALKIIGYSMLFVTISNNHIISPILLIVAELLFFIRALNSLIKLDKNCNESEHKKARIYFEYKASRNEMLIRGMAALMLASLVSLWCFMPASFSVAIPLIIAITLVKIIKKLSLHLNTKIIDKQLIDKFVSIENPIMA